MEFANKVAVVTGAAKGIGAATLRAFLREGASVVAVDVDQDGANALLDELGADRERVLFVRADVSSAVDTAQVAVAAVERFGGVDVLVNNAGIQTYGTVETTSEEVWDRTIAVNLKSVFLMSKFCVPEIRKRGGGAIVNVASTQALATQPAVAAYAATKGGIVAMTRSMALDHAAENIRVNAVCPGSVDTPMLRWAAELEPDADPNAVIERWGHNHALRRVAQPSEVAEMILFLASPRASFCTGTYYVVDGGQLASAS